MLAELSHFGGAATPNDFGGFSGVTKRNARTTNRFLSQLFPLVPRTFPVGRTHALACVSMAEGR